MTGLDVNAIPNTDWETLVSAGITLAQDMDARRFELGDVGALVATRYGDNTLGKYAAEIGMARAHTFREYVRVARGYSIVTRGTFLEAGLSWSHFREALGAGDLAVEFLARAADEGWPVAALAREIARAKGERVPPRKVFEGPGVIGETSDGLLYIVPEGDCGELAAGLRVTVKVWTEAADGN